MKALLVALTNSDFTGITESLNSFYSSMMKAGYLTVYETKAIISIGNIAVADVDMAETVLKIAELLALYTSRTEVVVGNKTFKADSLFGKSNVGVASTIDGRRVNNVSIDDDGAITLLLQRKLADSSSADSSINSSEVLKSAMAKFRASTIESE